VRALVQRVSSASVDVDGALFARIGPGMVVLLGVAAGDTRDEAERMARKLRALRIFDDDEGRMNEALGDSREVLCISQFTLYGDVSRGNRPGWSRAAPGERAQPLYELVCDLLGAERGVFGAEMSVDLVNEGPVTLIVEIDPPA
jgi:D-tyrosyl-tRNA(Tyr) deacylase